MSHPKHMTHKFNVSFDLKTVVPMEGAEAALQKIVAHHKENVENKVPVTKQTVFAGLVAEAYETKGIEAAVVELMRFNLREMLKDELSSLFHNTEIKTMSPVTIKVVRD